MFREFMMVSGMPAIEYEEQDAEINLSDLLEFKATRLADTSKNTTEEVRVEYLTNDYFNHCKAVDGLRVGHTFNITLHFTSTTQLDSTNLTDLIDGTSDPKRPFYLHMNMRRKADGRENNIIRERTLYQQEIYIRKRPLKWLIVGGRVSEARFLDRDIQIIDGDK